MTKYQHRIITACSLGLYGTIFVPVVVQLLSSCCPVNDWTTTGQQLDNDWTTNGVGMARWRRKNGAFRRLDFRGSDGGTAAAA